MRRLRLEGFAQGGVAGTARCPRSGAAETCPHLPGRGSAQGAELSGTTSRLAKPSKNAISAPPAGPARAKRRHPRSEIRPPGRQGIPLLSTPPAHYRALLVPALCVCS